MLYKSSLLAVTVVLLAAGNAKAADVSLVQDVVSGQRSEIISRVSVLNATNNADPSDIKDRSIHQPVSGVVKLVEAAATVPSSKLVGLKINVPAVNIDAQQAEIISDLVEPTVTKIHSAVTQAPVNLPAKDLVDSLATENQVNAMVAGSDIVPDQRVNADILPIGGDQIADLSAAVPSSLEVDLTQKWEITDAVTLNEVLLTPPSERVAQVTAEAVEPEPKKWAVSVHTQFSTTGFIGVDAGYKFSPNLHARLGLNTVGFSANYNSQGIDYNASLSPTNVHLLGDFFPFGGGLRLTGGLVLQSNQFNGTGTPSGSSGQINLGGTNYNASDVGTLSSQGSFSSGVAPYLGIGFGTPLSSGLGFNFDAGVMFAGSPTVKLRANNISSAIPAAQQDAIRRDLADQERRTNNDISSFSVYPVISIGLSYAF